MNLIIHDLSKEEWERVASDYEGWEVISDNGYIKPCVGCFGCWIKTPGECVIKVVINSLDRKTVDILLSYSILLNIKSMNIGSIKG